MLQSPNSGLNKMTPDQMQMEIVRLSREVESLKQGITRDISHEQKLAVREIIGDKIADIIWDKFFYVSGFTPFTVDATTANPSYTVNGEIIERLRDSSGYLFLSTKMPSKFRCGFYFGGPNLGAGCTAYITTMHVRTASGTVPIKDNGAEFIGLKIVNNRVYLCSYDDSTGTEKLIDTQKVIVDDETIILEILFFPRERADFYINNEFIGTITGVLPSNQTPIIFYPILCSLKPSDSGEHKLNIDYYEFLQQRKNT